MENAPNIARARNYEFGLGDGNTALARCPSYSILESNNPGENFIQNQLDSSYKNVVSYFKDYETAFFALHYDKIDNTDERFEHVIMARNYFSTTGDLIHIL